MARGRKAADNHVCDKKNPDDAGKWIVKDGQEIELKKPTDLDSWNDIMSQKILVECNKCGVAKICTLEKLNIVHFEGTSYKIDESLWDKAIVNGMKNDKNIEDRKQKINKLAESLKKKAEDKRNKSHISSIKDSIISGNISVTAKAKD